MDSASSWKTEEAARAHALRQAPLPPLLPPSSLQRHMSPSIPAVHAADDMGDNEKPIISNPLSAPSTTSQEPSHGETITLPEAGSQSLYTEERRTYLARACDRCRRRKIKCDRLQPCGPCKKSKLESCTYKPKTSPPARRGRVRRDAAKNGPLKLLKRAMYEMPQSQLPPLSPERQDMVNANGPSALQQRQSQMKTPWGPNTSKADKIASLIQWVTSLQSQLKRARSAKSENDVNHEDNQAGPEETNNLLCSGEETQSRVRYFARAHWMRAILMFPMELNLLIQAKSAQADVYWIMVRCKDLARKIKDARVPKLDSFSLHTPIPSRDIADSLVASYLRTYEGLFRILHVPSFLDDYDAYWKQPGSSSQVFIIQLKLVLAIGAAFQDEAFSLRKTAIHWVYEAQLWLMLPPEKDKLTFTALQIGCLICIARNVCSVGPDMTWISAGSLVRKAMMMGLHRDPRQLGAMSVYTAEIRRRLWATVVELDIEYASDSGGCFTMTEADWNTLPPANLNDEDLTREPDVRRPTPGSIETPTLTSVQIALQRSVPIRIAVLRHVNSLNGEQAYNDTLALNHKLMSVYQQLITTLQDLRRIEERDSAARKLPVINHFHISMADLMVSRWFLTLHQPVVMRSLADPRFYFSRKMYFDTALKMAQVYRSLREGHTVTWKGQVESSTSERDFDRLAIHGSGMIRIVAIQFLLGVGLKLSHLKDDELLNLEQLSIDGNGADKLKSYLTALRDWMVRRIRSGDTAVKVYCYVSAIIANHEHLHSGASLREIRDSVLQVVTDAAIEGYKMLQELAIAEEMPNQGYNEGEGGSAPEPTAFIASPSALAIPMEGMMQTEYPVNGFFGSLQDINQSTDWMDYWISEDDGRNLSQQII